MKDQAPPVSDRPPQPRPRAFSRSLAGLLLVVLCGALAYVLTHERVHPYTYCIKGNCTLMTKETQIHFFGVLPGKVHRYCREPDMYALTFDDGPTPNWDELLDLLGRHHVQATFFVLGRNLADPLNQDRLRRAHDQGHQISNHSVSHVNMLDLADSVVIQEFEETRRKIVEILGSTDRIKFNASVVRPPYGFIDHRIQNILANENFTTVRWNMDIEDVNLVPGDTATYLSRFNSSMRFLDQLAIERVDRSIIDLNHDSVRATLDSLPGVIKGIRERGYRFVTVSECVGHPRSG